ncbi:permease-like cell division protein FtsX [Candidatus Dojkabacteria bacterium]|uniref:Cell division protein FtsX n=1 Tax=Candidatus Dojkabacteria bacterium TaxID=2099670 RepID=A0A955L757_9BACT|nr:permease-like cell division protein FtsX [Candidatus Dojkabacteria bacterium]
MQTLLRALKTTFKQIRRSGWLTWASIAVMTLSFLILTVFFALGFVMEQVLVSIESDPHIYVFYKPGVPELKIEEKKEEWESLDNIESIIYTSEEAALEEFQKYNQKANPITAEAIREDVLPASLGIRLKRIDDAQNIIDIVESEASTNADILDIGYSQTVIENIKDLVTIARIIGIVILALLSLVILLFTLLTVEFKIYYRSEEIGIMQLVGGSLWYIRLPFILESTIYGMLGALLSNGILVGSYYAILYYYSESDLLIFLNRFFGTLPWPDLSMEILAMALVALILAGGAIGMINSFIAIRRYIR